MGRQTEPSLTVHFACSANQAKDRTIDFFFEFGAASPSFQELPYTLTTLLGAVGYQTLLVGL